MPGLKWCGARWGCASDDFVFPQLTLAGLSGGLAAAAFAAFDSLDMPADQCPDADERRHVRYWLRAQVGTFLFVAVACLAVAASAVRGTPLSVSRRSCVPTALTLEFVGILAAAGVSGWGARVVIVDDECGDVDHWEILFALLVTSWVVAGLAVCCMCCTFELSQRHIGEDMSDGGYSRYAGMWAARCRCIARLRPCVNDDEEGDFEGVGRVLASSFRGLDVTSSDIAAGLVLLRTRQQQRRKERQHINVDSLLSPTGPDQTLLGCDSRRLKLSTETDKLPPVTPAVAAALTDFDTFFNHAHAAYGWMLQIYAHPVTVWGRLCGAMCGGSCSVPMQGGNCCGRMLSSATLIAEGVGEVIMASYSNALGVPVWYLAVDRERQAIVVAFRGTLSTSDVLTDGTATPVPFPEDGDVAESSSLGGMAHKGFVQCARNVYAKLERGKVVEKLLEEHPSFRVVVLGHSMGAGVAALVGVLLRQNFPGDNFKTLAYAVPGGLMNRKLADSTTAYTTCLVVGKDLVSRLGMHSMQRFREELLQAVADTKRSKCTVLCCCCRKDPGFYFGDCDEVDAEVKDRMDVYRLRARLPSSPRSAQHHSATRVLTEVMYPPTRTLLLSKMCDVKGRCCGSSSIYYPQFIDTEELQEVVASPAMILDHFPDRGVRLVAQAVRRYKDGLFTRLSGEVDVEAGSQG